MKEKKERAKRLPTFAELPSEKAYSATAQSRF